ncbi:MAG: UDP-N-acetylglucosamine 1-carboxyvinyltransferase [Nitrospinota bacterium]|nr:MAG: UDP-N-acetylglucosamine 1-carboxyvinyltransferase [Nitrospinota bacterium]
MERMRIEGGTPLQGCVRISGAKNAVLPILMATLLAAGEHRICNVPRLRDVETSMRLLQELGARVEREGDVLVVDTTSATGEEAPYELVKTMRASFLVLGPLLARFGYARVSLPGGCAIGARPVDLHLKGLRAMGADIKIEHGYVVARSKRLRGAHLYMDLVTVTGTENLMMAAVTAEGTTVIENAAREPEVVNLAEALNRMGARVQGAGSSTITIEGVSALRPSVQEVIPDRIECGTFMAAAAITGGDVRIEGCIPQHLQAVITKLRESGVWIETGDTWIRVRGEGRLRGVDVITMPYPGFPTDMQAQMMACMTLAHGHSVITETVFENRFMHVAELQRMGADLTIDGHSVLVRGVERLSGAPVMATDLRASASLILAGLAAQGETVLSRIYHIDRGYERIEEKLARLGAKIWRER